MFRTQTSNCYSKRLPGLRCKFHSARFLDSLSETQKYRNVFRQLAAPAAQDLSSCTELTIPLLPNLALGSVELVLMKAFITCDVTRHQIFNRCWCTAQVVVELHRYRTQRSDVLQFQVTEEVRIIIRCDLSKQVQ